jgi:hypothetical protein
MINIVFLIPAFIIGWTLCYVAMTYGVDQSE